jgi:3-dehydroquinate synthase/shikimate kinase/3-dehydroquinate synthase
MSSTKLQINTNNHKYSIIIGSNILGKLQSFFKKNFIDFNQCLIIADKNVPKYLIKKFINHLPKKKIIHYFDAN